MLGVLTPEPPVDAPLQGPHLYSSKNFIYCYHIMDQETPLTLIPLIYPNFSLEIQLDPIISRLSQSETLIMSKISWLMSEYIRYLP